MTHMHAIDFGYPWWLTHGHLAVLVPALAALFAGRARKWPLWAVVLLGLIAAWAAAAFLLVHSIDINRPPALPTESFFRSGAGRVLDLGAGTGRSAIMVLQARPQAQLVALDLFGDSFTSHFGARESPQLRLQRNLAAAGVDSRASIVTGDMRKLAFENESFDTIVSAYAVDHLGRQGAAEALREARRILKPSGDFLLILAANDAKVKFAFGPLLSHGGTRGPEWWKQQVEQAGFEVAEQGSEPTNIYFLLKPRPGK